MATLTLKRRAPSLGALPPAAPTTPVVIDTPLPSASNINKAAVQGASLYHTCRSVLDRLAAVEGMTEFLDMTITSDEVQQTTSSSTSTPIHPSTSTSTASSTSSTGIVEPTTPTTSTTPILGATHTSNSNNNHTTDPLSKLWSICRRGLPLCILFNALQLEKPLKVDDRDPNLNQINTCKASVYHFLVACRNQLEFPEDDVFTITDLYSNDTNGFVKVVNTINKILQLLEQKGLISVRCANRNSDPNAPKDTRGKVVMELLETERKYVQDLEILQTYMRELQNQKVLSLDTIHYLFGNLNALVDFQRRFLIMVEDMAEKPAKEQRIGLLFVQMEEAFAVYEPYCANYYSAQDLVVQEAPKLQKLADVLNPTYELPSFLIKPVQRICKYPLLMRELVNSTNKDWPCFTETNDGLEAIKRVAEKVNETQRKHENVQAVEDLKKRIDDNSASIETYGSLLVQDKLGIMNKDTEREMAVFLFEKTLLICKENKDAAKNRLTKSNTIMKKKRRGSLQERLRIPASRILGVHNRSQNGVWLLSIEYKAPEVEVFSLRLRNEEQMKLWETTLSKIKASSRCHVPNTHLYSMPSPTHYGDSASFMDDEDEEDDYYDDELVLDENDPTIAAAPAPTRSRSNSISAQLFNTLSGRPKGEVKSRQYQHQMPGMNLSPLPRASASTNTHSMHHSHHYNNQHPDYTMYPVSPPPSHPSSPTSSTRVSTGANNGWHHHHPHHSLHHRRGDDSPLIEIASKFMSGDVPTPTDEELRHFPLPPAVNRSQSQSAAVGLGVYNTSPSIPAVPTTTNKQQHNRMRSQSSPNIHKAASISAQAQAAAAMMPPQYPLNSARELDNVIRPVASTPRLSDAGLKVKLSYNDGIYAIKAAEDICYAELMHKVEKKIRLIGNLKPQDNLRLKYQDEDGDYITINSDDDVQMAFENRGRSPSVSLYVNV